MPKLKIVLRTLILCSKVGDNNSYLHSYFTIVVSFWMDQLNDGYSLMPRHV